MKRENIDFRALLERVLPVAELPLSDRQRVQLALSRGVARELEAAALLAMEQLEGQGALRRVPAHPDAQTLAVSYQPRDRFEIITLELPAPAAREGILVFPRAGLPSRGLAGFDQVRHLIQLDEPATLSDPRTGGPSTGALQQLEQAASALFGTNPVSFHAAGAPEEGPGAPLHAIIARDAVAHPHAVLYCADATAVARLSAPARARRVRSVIWVAVASGANEPFGHLEVRSPEPNAFAPEDLARAALLADTCAAALERATRIERMVFVDPHTAAYNRSYFDLQALNEMARAQREGTSVALCIADIDDFKSFNTTYGYEAGNQVLAQVAQSLRRAVRPFDTVARWGGEEFAVLLTAPVQAQDVRTISERLRTSIERNTLRLEGLDRRAYRVSVTVSIGVALFPDHAQDFPGLWRAANQALLEAKRPPKNQVVFYRAL